MDLLLYVSNITFRDLLHLFFIGLNAEYFEDNYKDGYIICFSLSVNDS